MAMCTNWYAVGLPFYSACLLRLFVAAGIMLASQIARVMRWGQIIGAAGLDRPRSHLLAAYFKGMSVNVWLPTRIGGDLLEIVRLSGSRNKRIVTASVVVQRVFRLISCTAFESPFFRGRVTALSFATFPCVKFADDTTC
jgi:uncharacterized membrane protein YbhN (UPF0104 family)